MNFGVSLKTEIRIVIIQVQVGLNNRELEVLPPPASIVNYYTTADIRLFNSVVDHP